MTGKDLNDNQFNNNPKEMTDDELLKWASEKTILTHKSRIILFCIILSIIAFVYLII